LKTSTFEIDWSKIIFQFPMSLTNYWKSSQYQSLSKKKENNSKIIIDEPLEEYERKLIINYYLRSKRD